MAPAVPIDFGRQRESTNCSHKGIGHFMGKAREVPLGHSAGFVPDYRHAAETMADSEGFGSSGRVDTEMTVSEDSCAPKRKCLSLNSDSYDRFGVPMQVLSMSKMTQSEKKVLELRLKSELDQVRVLQKRIASLNSNIVPSLSSDIHSCSEGQKKPTPVSFQGSRGVVASHGKKRVPPGRNGSRTKKPTAGKVESANQTLPGVSNTMLMKQCETLLNRLMSHQHSWVFNEPVDVVKLNIPDYFNVIKHPMDFGTVKSKLILGEYFNPLGFAADVRLTFSNAMTYNPKGNNVHLMAEGLSKYFETRWKPIEKKLPLALDKSVLSKSSIATETETAEQVPPPKRKKIIQQDNKIDVEPVKQVMTDVEKLKLSTELEALAELPESIIDFLKESTANGSQMSEDEIEIDIDALADDTLFALRKLLDEYLLGKQKMQVKSEPCEVELHNEPGISNSSGQPCACNDPVDEEVDLGGTGLPITNFPSVEIEKGVVLRNSRCSSSSSSSSESGSSSSDSDSRTSPGNESDGAKALGPAITTNREPFASTTNLELHKDDIGGRVKENGSSNDFSQIEQTCCLKPVSVEAVDYQEGESAPSGRQVSPDKLYRAALLRNRFADTILKAQEKTLDKGEKLDPEKLRLEREELERRRIEEKARLQAEAKAAEEARRKAEAEAAAEAKRKREIEREAAREALQKMEKTVDINENCQLLEDLEMLRAAPAEDLQNFIDEASPDHSQNGLGSFKLQGNNPLEQLGLYIKVDDEEEEEDKPPSISGAADDTEKGKRD